MFKLIFTGIAGIAVGFAAGYYVAKCHFKQLHEADMQDMREYYEGKHPEKPEYESEHKVEAHTMDEPYEKPNKVDYQQFYDPSESEGPKDDIPEDEDDTGSYMTNEYKKNKNRAPIIIKKGEYGDMDNWKTMDLKYYQESETLVFVEGDEEDMIYFDEIEDVVGNSLVKFGFADNDEPVIFVRNFSRGCDFRIEKVFGAFEG